jgi:hypothetical protein
MLWLGRLTFPREPKIDVTGTLLAGVTVVTVALEVDSDGNLSQFGPYLRVKLKFV